MFHEPFTIWTATIWTATFNTNKSKIAVFSNEANKCLTLKNLNQRSIWKIQYAVSIRAPHTGGVIRMRASVPRKVCLEAHGEVVQTVCKYHCVEYTYHSRYQQHGYTNPCKHKKNKRSRRCTEFVHVQNIQILIMINILTNFELTNK
jgi:hypothetical protein